MWNGEALCCMARGTYACALGRRLGTCQRRCSWGHTGCRGCLFCTTDVFGRDPRRCPVFHARHTMYCCVGGFDPCRPGDGHAGGQGFVRGPAAGVRPHAVHAGGGGGGVPGAAPAAAGGRRHAGVTRGWQATSRGSRERYGKGLRGQAVSCGSRGGRPCLGAGGCGLRGRCRHKGCVSLLHRGLLPTCSR